MDIEQKIISRNIPKIYILGGLWMFLLPMAILVPFFNSRSLSMQQVFQLQAIFSFGVLVLEIPSGYVSDLLGRKNTLICACAFHGAGFAMFPYCDSFFLFIIAEILLAFAVSLFSGTDVALLYDTLEAMGHKSDIMIS
jgi:MFS family permease